MMDIRVDANSRRLLAEALRLADKKTDQAFEKSSNQAMWHICRSGSATVKPRSMAAKREIQQANEALGFKFSVRVLKQDGGHHFFFTNDRNDPIRKIKALGLASLVFKLAGSKFGKMQGGKMFAGAKRFFTTHQRKAATQIVLRTILFLSYLETAFPGVANTAISKGITAFVHSFDSDWAKAIKEGRAWA